MKTSYYDNGGKTFDRITVIFDDTKNGNMYDCLVCSYTGSGFFQHSTAMKGRHLGRKVQFSDLSDELQRRLTSYFNECGAER
jgi:hypothetical protein